MSSKIPFGGTGEPNLAIQKSVPWVLLISLREGTREGLPRLIASSKNSGDVRIKLLFSLIYYK